MMESRYSKKGVGFMARQACASELKFREQKNKTKEDCDFDLVNNKQEEGMAELEKEEPPITNVVVEDNGGGPRPS